MKHMPSTLSKKKRFWLNMECTVQKKKGRASKAVELTIRICHSVRPIIDPSDLVRRTLVAAI
jgi:hypothetical protein